MQKYFLIVVVFVLFGSTFQLNAQTGLAIDTIDNQIIYSNEKSGFVVAHSNGIGIGYRTGKVSSVFTARSLAFELVTLQSAKQWKTINPYYANSKRYVYGKLNDVAVLRSGFSSKQLLNRKPYWGGVEVHWVYEAGLNMAIVKPYYLFVIVIKESPVGGPQYSVETKKFNADAMSFDEIYGRAPFTKGLNEIKLVPGAFGKLGLNFEFGTIKTTTRSMEAGIILDFFPQSVQIIDNNNNQTIFLNFYVSLAIGKRFNKF